MQWHNVGEFFAMGGYAPYVWGSVGLCALAMAAEPWLLRRQHRLIVQALRQQRHSEPLTRDARSVVAIRRQAA